MARADFRFAYRKRVRYPEIDAQAVVYNPRFLDYLDIVVSEYFRAIGLGGPGGHDQGFQSHVARTVIDYRAPIHLDEEIDLCVRCVRIGSSSMTFAFEFHGHDADNLRAEGETVAVHIGTLGSRPTPVPDATRAMIEAYEGRSLKA